VRLVSQGRELAGLHLIAPVPDKLVTGFSVKGDNLVEKVAYMPEKQCIWINAEQYFSGVAENVWEFTVGGYQVCEKWMKDRKGTKLKL
jgi:hypothetical protein